VYHDEERARGRLDAGDRLVSMPGDSALAMGSRREIDRMDSTGMGEGMGLHLQLWKQLVARAARKGIRYEDAQELASKTFEKAIETYDPTRGPFAPLCRTIHANLVKNYWRDRKPHDPLDPDDDRHANNPDFLEDLITGEVAKMMRAIGDKILAVLEPEEQAFFLTLAEVMGVAEKAAVSEAARRLGLEPLVGWNIFRRIQRKARPFTGEFESVEAAPSGPWEELRSNLPDESETYELRPMRSMSMPQSRSMELSAFDRLGALGLTSLLFLASACADAGFERFASSLSAEQRARLAAVAG
jgi:DNA-directed RNA polymerase specialized sigma24 family protein